MVERRRSRMQRMCQKKTVEQWEVLNHIDNDGQGGGQDGTNGIMKRGTRTTIMLNLSRCNHHRHPAIPYYHLMEFYFFLFSANCDECKVT